MAAAKKTSLDFEKSMTKLNELIEKMESPDLSLENSLKHFEEGVMLIKQCQETLMQAEQKVKILTEKNGQSELEPFE